MLIELYGAGDCPFTFSFPKVAPQLHILPKKHIYLKQVVVKQLIWQLSISNRARFFLNCHYVPHYLLLYNKLLKIDFFFNQMIPVQIHFS